MLEDAGVLDATLDEDSSVKYKEDVGKDTVDDDVSDDGEVGDAPDPPAALVRLSASACKATTTPSASEN